MVEAQKGDELDGQNDRVRVHPDESDRLGTWRCSRIHAPRPGPASACEGAQGRVAVRWEMLPTYQGEKATGPVEAHAASTGPLVLVPYHCPKCGHVEKVEIPARANRGRNAKGLP